MNLSLLSGELWHWTSPVWLVAASILAAFIVAFRSTARLWILLFGLALLVLVYVSPIGVLADGYLFSAHMLQHLALLLVIPLCIVLSLPKQKMQDWLDRSRAAWLRQFLSVPAIGWICGLGAMWFWHMPVFCAASTESFAIGLFRDVTFLAAGLIFWWPIYSPIERQRLQPPVAVVYLFSACLGCTLLGTYITFTTVTVCPAFANPIDRIGILNMLYNSGLTPGIDQNLGGLLMWVPPCFLYVGAIVSIFCRWYVATEAPQSSLTASAGGGQS